MNAAEMIDRLHQAIVGFTDSQPQDDDLTAIVIRKR